MNKPLPLENEPALTFHSRDVVQLAQITFRQLQWWDERHLVSPDQQKHQRLYRFDETVEMMLIAELRRKGYSLQRIRGLMRSLERRLLKALNNGGEYPTLYVMTNGKSVSLERDEDRMIDILKQATQGTAIVSVTDQIESVHQYLTAADSKCERGKAATAGR
jgi:DNA-binding transcriptional MerR regulator